MNTSNGRQRLTLKYYISALRKKRKLCTWPREREGYRERDCNISYKAGKVILENMELFLLPHSSKEKKYLNLIRVV